MPDCNTPIPLSPFNEEATNGEATATFGSDNYASKNSDETITIDGGDDDPQYSGYDSDGNTSTVIN